MEQKAGQVFFKNEQRNTMDNLPEMRRKKLYFGYADFRLSLPFALKANT